MRLQIVLDKGNDADWFNSTFIIVTSIISAINLAIFLIWELTDKDPIVDLKLFRHRNFTAGTIALVLAYAAFFAIGLLVPLWLQRNLGYTATWAGYATAPLGIIPVLLTFFVGKYAQRMDLRLLASVAFLVMGLTCFMRSDFNLQVDFSHVAHGAADPGPGRGAVLHADPDHPAVGPEAERDRLRLRAGHLPAHAGRQFRRLDHHLPVGPRARWSITSSWPNTSIAYNPASQAAMQQLGQGDNQVGGSIINGMITQQGFQISFNEVFHMLGWVFLGLIVVIWLAKPPFGGKPGPAAGGH